MLEIDNLSIEIVRKPIVRDFSGAFPAGTLTSIIGPNGAGKSTLLRAIAGLLPLTRGTVLYEQKDLLSLSPRRRARKVSYLPQTMEYASSYPVSLFVELAGYPWSDQWDEPWRQEHLHRCLDLCNVYALRHRDIATLSGGERQCVYLAQVMYQNTPIVLLDEPNSFLDLKNMVLIENILSRIRDEGRSILLVTHDLQTVQRISTNVVAMKDGGLFIAGDPQSVLNSSVISELFDLDSSAVRERFQWTLADNK
ncbi:MAG: ABC transporter ATP-binding protein [bacterium]